MSRHCLPEEAIVSSWRGCERRVQVSGNDAHEPVRGVNMEQRTLRDMGRERIMSILASMLQVSRN